MTTTTTSTPHPAVVALPPQAVEAEDWQPNAGNGFYRNFEGEERKVVTGAGAKLDAHAVFVYAHGVQHDDGSIDDGTTDPVFEAPAMSITMIDDEDGL
jgi:hypothetical protein